MGVLRVRRVKVRRRWVIHPRTRVVASGKVYKRAKKRQETFRILKEGEEDITA